MRVQTPKISQSGSLFLVVQLTLTINQLSFDCTHIYTKSGMATMIQKEKSWNIFEKGKHGSCGRQQMNQTKQ